MKVVKEYEVSCCNKCPYIRNPAADHDDPFTSTPYYGNSCNYKKCTHAKGPSYIADYRVIDKNCPFLQTPN